METSPAFMESGTILEKRLTKEIMRIIMQFIDKIF